MNDHAELIAKFVATFPFVARDLGFYEVLDPVAAQLAIGPKGEYGRKEWRPSRVTTDPQELAALYAKLPARFPPLFELLVLSYRWQKPTCSHSRCLPIHSGKD
jgi:glycine/D-amino acid oxidase-like deaminating enzyme